MEEIKEKIKLHIKEVLLSLVDISEDLLEPFYKRYNSLYKEYINYKKSRMIDKNNYYQKIWRLEKQGFIKKYKNYKNTEYKLTKKGRKKALKYIFDETKLEIPKVWDGKWRMIIFDIPEEKKYLRDVVRTKIRNLGFYQLQKSVWVYPFDCQDIVMTLKYIYSLGKYVQYILAESIETETDLADYFYKQNIIKRDVKFK